jgi:hypothetical protein
MFTSCCSLLRQKHRYLSRLSLLCVISWLGLFTDTTPVSAIGFGLDAPPSVEQLLKTPVQKPQVKANQPSERSLTVPGLWWANQQFGDKMLTNWFAYRRPQDRSSQVRAIVRPDLWSRYTYLERYAFLKRFGATTSAAGYHLLVLDRQNYLLGSYTCDFPNDVKPAPLNPWERRSARLTTPAIKAPCSVWISPVYGTEFF